jgi:hypothetical protein
MALSFAESTGTSTKDFLTVLSHGAILQSRDGVFFFFLFFREIATSQAWVGGERTDNN